LSLKYWILDRWNGQVGDKKYIIQKPDLAMSTSPLLLFHGHVTSRAFPVVQSESYDLKHEFLRIEQRTLNSPN
jgi:hypothetical protein